MKFAFDEALKYNVVGKFYERIRDSFKDIDTVIKDTGFSLKGFTTNAEIKSGMTDLVENLKKFEELKKDNNNGTVNEINLTKELTKAQEELIKSREEIAKLSALPVPPLADQLGSAALTKGRSPSESIAYMAKQPKFATHIGDISETIPPSPPTSLVPPEYIASGGQLGEGMFSGYGQDQKRYWGKKLEEIAQMNMLEGEVTKEAAPSIKSTEEIHKLSATQKFRKPGDILSIETIKRAYERIAKEEQIKSTVGGKDVAEMNDMTAPGMASKFGNTFKKMFVPENLDERMIRQFKNKRLKAEGLEEEESPFKESFYKGSGFESLGKKFKKVGFTGEEGAGRGAMTGLALKGAGAIGGLAVKLGGKAVLKGAEIAGSALKSMGDLALSPITGTLDAVKGLFSAFKPFEVILKPLTSLMGSLGDIMGAQMAPALQTLIPAFFNEKTIALVTSLGQTMLPIMNMLGNVITSLMPVITPFVEGIGKIFGALGQIFDKIFANPAFQEALKIMGKALGDMFTQIAEILGRPEVADLLTLIMTNLVKLFSNVFAVIGPLLESLMPVFMAFGNAFAWILEKLAAGILWIPNIVTRAVNLIIDILNALDFLNLFKNIEHITVADHVTAPSLDNQGIIERSGIARVHTGEAVVRKELIGEIMKEIMITQNFYGQQPSYYEKEEMNSSLKRLF